MADDFVPCPKCGKTNAKRVGYTWWGGALGPRMFNEVKCQDCGATFNGKTGKSNTTNIIIYSVAIFVVFFVLYFMVSNM